jgi:hypothetical protein
MSAVLSAVNFILPQEVIFCPTCCHETGRIITIVVCSLKKGFRILVIGGLSRIVFLPRLGERPPYTFFLPSSSNPSFRTAKRLHSVVSSASLSPPFTLIAIYLILNRLGYTTPPPFTTGVRPGRQLDCQAFPYISPLIWPSPYRWRYLVRWGDNF